MVGVSLRIAHNIVFDYKLRTIASYVDTRGATPDPVERARVARIHARIRDELTRHEWNI